MVEIELTEEYSNSSFVNFTFAYFSMKYKDHM